ncbi:MAG: hypothetical protein GXY19_16205 [Phycisphaerae bacterium]|nr:hypothetical protein [Phycisphaerae bacterium]
MNLHGIVARSGQAFKYILDPNVDLMSPSQAAQLAEAQRQLDDVRRKLDENEKASREKDTLIARLRDELAAKAEPAKPTLPQEAESDTKRKATRKTPAQAKPAQTRHKSRSRKPRPTTAREGAKAKGRSKRTGNGPKA